MGERHTSKTKYRFEVHIPKRQVLRKQKCGCPQRSDLRGDAVHLFFVPTPLRSKAGQLRDIH